MLVTKQNLFIKSGSLRDLRSNFVTFVFALLTMVFLAACSSSHPDPHMITVLIEFSPNNLDPRIGTDAQSERIDELLFDSLVKKDEHFNLQPWVAERWEIADPLTYVFHLHRGIRFHN